MAARYSNGRRAFRSFIIRTFSRQSKLDLRGPEATSAVDDCHRSHCRCWFTGVVSRSPRNVFM
eukprot:6333670-Alexandrium_andersonii.AAC.1